MVTYAGGALSLSPVRLTRGESLKINEKHTMIGTPAGLDFYTMTCKNGQHQDRRSHHAGAVIEIFELSGGELGLCSCASGHCLEAVVDRLRALAVLVPHFLPKQKYRPKPAASPYSLHFATERVEELAPFCATVSSSRDLLTPSRLPEHFLCFLVTWDEKKALAVVKHDMSAGALRLIELSHACGGRAMELQIWLMVVCQSTNAIGLEASRVSDEQSTWDPMARQCQSSAVDLGDDWRQTRWIAGIPLQKLKRSTLSGRCAAVSSKRAFQAARPG